MLLKEIKEVYNGFSIASGPLTRLLVPIVMVLHVRVFLWNLVQLDMKDVEDETVKGRTQTVTEATDARDHALTHACGSERKMFSGLV